MLGSIVLRAIFYQAVPAPPRPAPICHLYNHIIIFACNLKREERERECVISAASFERDGRQFTRAPQKGANRASSPSSPLISPVKHHSSHLS